MKRSLMQQGASALHKYSNITCICSTIHFTLARVVAETEEVGNEIIGELGRNREKIESTQDKVKQVNSDMDVAKTTVKRMNDREKRCTIS